MIMSYQDCVGKYGSDYQIKKMIADGLLFMKEKGIYSTQRNASELDVIMHKYPKAILTARSAFYYHSLTDVIPDHYYLATRRTDTRIHDHRVVQSFLKDDIFEAGNVSLQYNQSSIRIYNLERMLIELMRFRSTLSLDYYKEIIQSYRKIVFEIDIGLVEDYASMFRNGPKLMDMIQMEVL